MKIQHAVALRVNGTGARETNRDRLVRHVSGLFSQAFLIKYDDRWRAQSLT